MKDFIYYYGGLDHISTSASSISATSISLPTIHLDMDVLDRDSWTGTAVVILTTEESFCINP